MEIYAVRDTSWMRALNAARMTVGKMPIDKEPTDSWKEKMIRAEHSPIRLVEYTIYFKDIPTFVANHLARHHEGCEKFVVSHREDRSGINPEDVNRLTPVDMVMTCNIQALINISRARLCTCASLETRNIWKQVKLAIEKIDPIVAKFMQPNCIYRGYCPEFNSCGLIETNKYQNELKNYRKK